MIGRSSDSRETGHVFDSPDGRCLIPLKRPEARTQTFIFSEAPAAETFCLCSHSFWTLLQRHILSFLALKLHQTTARVGEHKRWHDVTFEDFTSQKPCGLTQVRTVSLPVYTFGLRGDDFLWISHEPEACVEQEIDAQVSLSRCLSSDFRGLKLQLVT